MASRRRHAAAFAIALLTFAASARAEPTPSEKETARSSMAEGRVRRDRKDLRAALESFRAADAIMHVPTTGLEVARTQVALGQLVEAAETLRAVVRTPAAPGEPLPFVAARNAAHSLFADVLTRIPSIRFTTSGGKDGIKVTIDDAAIPSEALGEPFKLDPGHHVIRMAQLGATTTREVDLAERELKVVALEAPTDAPAAVAATPEPSAAAPSPAAAPADVRKDEASAEPTTEPTPAGPSHTMRTVAWAGVAIAGAGVVAGSMSGLLSLSHTSDAKAICNGDHCPPAAAADLDAAHATGRVSTIAFIIAGAGAAAAIVGFLVGDPSPEAPRAGRVVPWIGPGAAGARVSF